MSGVLPAFALAFSDGLPKLKAWPFPAVAANGAVDEAKLANAFGASSRPDCVGAPGDTVALSGASETATAAAASDDLASATAGAASLSVGASPFLSTSSACDES